MMPLPCLADESERYAKPALPRARSNRTSLSEVPVPSRLSAKVMVRLTALVARSMATSFGPPLMRGVPEPRLPVSSTHNVSLESTYTLCAARKCVVGSAVFSVLISTFG